MDHIYYNSLTRITGILAPNLADHNPEVMQLVNRLGLEDVRPNQLDVKRQQFSYWIRTNKALPSFTLWSHCSLEVVERLIIKACMVNDLSELDLQLSNC